MAAQPALAQTVTGQQTGQEPVNNPNVREDQGDAVDQAGTEIVVTGIRQSIKTAQAIKFNSDQFVDSITATDIGKLPDKNVAEALQRISGVQIERSYGEGSGLAIRGLTQVKTELNGRDVFGGSSGRALGFEDVPSELLAGVDVYKDPSAREIEGGIGGLVNLRTRMPFDERGFVASTTMGANYYDLADEPRFNASGLISKTWEDTGIGDFGVLFDVSYFEGAFRRDQLTIEPYRETTNYPGSNGEARSIPDGAGIQVTDGHRKRFGLYGALQWQPSDNMEVYGTYFRSKYDIYTPNYSSFVTRSTSAEGLSYLEPYGDFSFGEDGRFQSGGYTGFIPPWTVPPYVNTGLNVQNNTQVHYSQSVTTDYAGGVNWEPVHNVHLNLDLQYTKATAEDESYTAFGQKDLAGYTIDLGGGIPQIDFLSPPGAQSIYDLSAYRFTAVMDHLEDSDADQKAAAFNLNWEFDEGPLKSLQGGLRYTERSAVNRSTPYNWTAAINSSDGDPLTLADAVSQGIPNPYAGRMFGDRTLMGPVPFAAFSLFDDPAYAFQALGGRDIIGFGPQDINTQKENTYTAWGMAYFGFDAGLPVDVNLGARIVRTENEAIGSTRLTYRPTLDAGDEAETVDQPFQADQEYTNFLPSINARVHLTPSLQLRAAASKGLSRPSFYDLRALRSLSVNYQQTTNPDGSAGSYYVTGATGNGGNPNLKPLRVDQADVALEWNVNPTSFLYGTLFYKKLHDFTTTRVFDVEYPVPDQGTRTFSYTGLVNGSEGTVKGFEVGGNTFFDFLPGPLSGFGVQANLTYVDSNVAGDGGELANGEPVPTELRGLSKWNYNLVGLYEKYGVTARVAYNWRSHYLDTITGNGTGAIPIYYRSYGQLDASISYDFTPKISVTLDAVNLLKERYDSYQYYSYAPRNYELNDRRFGITFRFRN
ncbi:TonB-dependent receptor [Stakelama saccharophila]|uniref:TonB-dependent receptor n=1 Tax=Stakelama saccharophila TaxID=3075605 RepID=A0ABZ0B6K3_9SPHN|nr:TonB-dependent receptor [Stakelama sp. W311]WNO52842.1 TonB-dependent receptor [Stakelama sp. W311]